MIKKTIGHYYNLLIIMLQSKGWFGIAYFTETKIFLLKIL